MVPLRILAGPLTLTVCLNAYASCEHLNMKPFSSQSLQVVVWEKTTRVCGVLEKDCEDEGLFTPVAEKRPHLEAGGQ